MGLIDIADSYSPQISVIGIILLDPKLMGEASLLLSAEDFQHPGCRMCWQAMQKIFREGREIDPVLLRDSLTGADNVNQFLMACMDAAPTAANFLAHVQALKRQAMLARLKDIGQLLTDCTDIPEAMELLDKANEISIQRQARERRNMAGMLSSFGARHAEQARPDYLQWPFRPLNEGIHAAGGKFIVIGGYPSDGKTAFALACAMVHARQQKSTVFYSFETDCNTVEDRLLATIANINMDNIQNNTLDDGAWQRFAGVSDASQWPFEVVAAAGMTVDDIRADALAHHYSVIYVDYLQLINPGRRSRNENRFEEVSEISRGLQRLAKTTGITVIALSQMARPQADKKGNVPEPSMHNLRESGQIEQDADVIMLLYRMDQKNIRAQRKLTIAKNKEGRTGRWWLDFDGEYQRFAMAQKQDGKESLPAAKGRHHPTPVLGESPQEQRSFYEVNGDDPNMPF